VQYQPRRQDRATSSGTLPQIEILVSQVVDKKKNENGGRLFYIGAAEPQVAGVVDASSVRLLLSTI
jgi:N-acetylmuramic acid 6-phosphate (MurNAc-6-P) etherase